MVGTEVAGDRAAGPVDVSRKPRLRAAEPVAAAADDPFSIALHDDRRSTVRAGEVVGIAGVAGNGQDGILRSVSGERLAAEPAMMRHRRQAGRPARRQRPPPARRRLRAGRAARPWRGAAHDACRRTCCCRGTRTGEGFRRAPASSIAVRHARLRGAASASASTCARARADPEGERAFRRQSAEIHRRPRARPHARRDGGQPADLGRRRRRGRRPSARR